MQSRLSSCRLCASTFLYLVFGSWCSLQRFTYDRRLLPGRHVTTVSFVAVSKFLRATSAVVLGDLNDLPPFHSWSTLRLASQLQVQISELFANMQKCQHLFRQPYPIINLSLYTHTHFFFIYKGGSTHWTNASVIGQTNEFIKQWKTFN